MTEPYKTEYRGLDSVAIMVKQDPSDKVHAPDHETFKDSKGEPLQVKCPECETTYIIGYRRVYRPHKSFETLAEQLRKNLLNDHKLKVSHRSALSLG